MTITLYIEKENQITTLQTMAQIFKIKATTENIEEIKGQFSHIKITSQKEDLMLSQQLEIQVTFEEYCLLLIFTGKKI